METLPQKQDQSPHHDVAIPVIVVAALVIGAMGGYAYGLGRAQQITAQATPNMAQAAGVGEAFSAPVPAAIDSSTTPVN